MGEGSLAKCVLPPILYSQLSNYNMYSRYTRWYASMTRNERYRLMPCSVRGLSSQAVQRSFRSMHLSRLSPTLLMAVYR